MYVAERNMGGDATIVYRSCSFLRTLHGPIFRCARIETPQDYLLAGFVYDLFLVPYHGKIIISRMKVNQIILIFIVILYRNENGSLINVFGITYISYKIH